MKTGFAVLAACCMLAGCSVKGRVDESSTVTKWVTCTATEDGGEDCATIFRLTGQTKQGCAEGNCSLPAFVLEPSLQAAITWCAENPKSAVEVDEPTRLAQCSYVNQYGTVPLAPAQEGPAA